LSSELAVQSSIDVCTLSPALIATKAPTFIYWAPFGVCGLLALPNIHQIFGDNLAKLPHFMRDEA
jgi:hypothetical protein